MYIKQITISGFKSYREAVGAGPFSPGHSVVVGRNGSGKSNFFDAVRFVLSDTYASLRAEERVALLHEGAGASVLSAYVEILFDNSDGRLPFDKDEVTLRRMVGLKKDEYVLDRKNVTRSEVFNLLESAGFSRANPYYIVQQGKVAALCAMSDKQRLDLLKEVAGTRVYDERHAEVLKIMEEDDRKRSKVKEAVEILEKRLSSLEGEKDELNNFQQLDKERRALEYTIYMIELTEARETLANLEENRAEESTRTDTLHTEMSTVEKDLASAEEHAETIKSSLSQSKSERKIVEKKHQELVKEVAKRQVEVSEAESAMAVSEETKESARVELAEIERDMNNKRQELEPLRTRFDSVQAEENNLKSRIAAAEARILALRVKADRGNHFTSVAERDAYLSNEIGNARNTLTTAEERYRDAVADVTRLERAIEDGKISVQRRNEELAPLRQQLQEEENELNNLKKQRDKAYNARHALWREESKIKDAMKNLSMEIRKLEAQKRSAFGSRAYKTLQSIMSYSRETEDSAIPEGSVYGSVADLIDVDPAFILAAEVTGAGALTHVIVSTDAVSAALIAYLQRTRGGRLTFIPLTQIARTVRPSRFERGTGDQDAIPLVSKIKCADEFRPAVNAIFGETLVTRTIPVATRLSKTLRSNCVTLDGDQVNKRGAMTGGYIAPTTSRISSAKALSEAYAELASLQDRQKDLTKKMEELSTEISRILSRIEVVSGKQRSTSSTVNANSRTVARLEHEIRSDSSLLESARRRVSEHMTSIEATQRRITSLESELGTELQATLSTQEADELEELVRTSSGDNNKMKDVQNSRVELEALVQDLEAQLKGNLERRAQELKNMISDDTDKEKEQHDLGSLRSELQNLQTEESKSAAQLQGIDENIKSLGQKMKENSEAIKSLRKRLSELKNRIAGEMSKLTALRDTRSTAIEKKAAAERHIRELGSVPSGVEKYRKNKNKTDLMRRLNRVNKDLKGFERVNRKALEQYMHFREQRQILERKRSELEKAADSIRALIGHLGRRKDEDIQRTFKGVSKCFTQVFSELVPGGIARLVMVKSAAGPKGDEPGRIEYSGVAMKVQFGGRSGEEFMIQQLSGGQKSVVAMALIFAIQRLDPAPFYLFDEVDANLDAVYRHAVAALIRKQADKGTQFITTTFRPELVNAADKWFGVTHKNKVSTIHEVENEVALTFITKDPS